MARFPRYANTLLKKLERRLRKQEFTLSDEARDLIENLLKDELESPFAIEQYGVYQFPEASENQINYDKVIDNFILSIKPRVSINIRTSSERGLKRLATKNMNAFADMLTFVHTTARDHALNFQNPDEEIKAQSVTTTMKKTCYIFPIC